MATKQTYAQKYANLYKLATANPTKTQNEIIEIAQKKGYGFRKAEMRQLIRETKENKTLTETKLTNEKLKTRVQLGEKIQSRVKLVRKIIGSGNIEVSRHISKNYIVPDPEDEKSWYDTAEKCFKGFKRVIKKMGIVPGRRSYRTYVLNAYAELDGQKQIVSSSRFDERSDNPTFEEMYESWFENLIAISQSLTADPLVFRFWIGFTNYKDQMIYYKDQTIYYKDRMI